MANQPFTYSAREEIELLLTRTNSDTAPEGAPRRSQAPCPIDLGPPTQSASASQCVGHLASALQRYPPPGLSACELAFEEKGRFDFTSVIRNSVSERVGKFRSRTKLLKAIEEVNRFALFLKLVYKRERQSRSERYLLLVRHEACQRRLLEHMITKEGLPKTAILVFVVNAKVYLLLLQELIMVDPKAKCPMDSKWFRELKLFSEKITKHSLRDFTSLWKARLEGVSPVISTYERLQSFQIPTVELQEKAFYKVTACIKDMYADGSGTVVEQQQLLCRKDGASLLVAMEKVKAMAEKSKTTYLSYICYEFDSILNLPLWCTTQWLQLTLQPISFYPEERLSSGYVALPCNHDRQSSETELLQPIITNRPIKTQGAILFGRLPTIPSSQYAYAMCSTVSGSLQLIEIASVPSAHAEIFVLEDEDDENDANIKLNEA